MTNVQVTFQKLPGLFFLLFPMRCQHFGICLTCR
uniref:Uncharacterized protein n=1 Tax=Rhizophora mucronata TaxID=61149 RepID=A0A2P2LV05_RHIMU